MRLTDDYQYESEDAEKEQQQQQTSKKLDEKESPKNQQKIIWVDSINGLIEKNRYKEWNISETF